MADAFAGLVPGRHVFYQHPSDGVLGAVVAKVLDEKEGRVNLALLLPSGMWINMREVHADPSVGGPSVERAVEGFLHGRWRWMFDGQATALTQTHAIVADPAATPPADPGPPLAQPVPSSAEGSRAE